MGKSSMKRFAGLGVPGVALAGLLAACGSSPSAPTPAYPTTVPAAAPVVTPAPEVLDRAEDRQPVGTRMPQIDGDLCRAAEVRHLVGQPRTAIPVPVDVINRRVTCTTCPITEDYTPYRLNIFFDQDTGIIEEVRCG